MVRGIWPQLLVAEAIIDDCLYLVGQIARRALLLPILLCFLAGLVDLLKTVIERSVLLINDAVGV